MTPQDAADFMHGILGEVWSSLGHSPNRIKWGDVPNEISTSLKPWARATVQHSEGGQASLSGGNGTRRFRNVGIYTVQLFMPIGDGSVANYGLAYAVKNGLQSAQDTNLWFRRIQLKEVDQSSPFTQINVLANFTYDDVR